MLKISSEVRVWNKCEHIKVKQNEKSKKKGMGPLFELTPDEVRMFLGDIMSQVNLCDPDEIMIVPPIRVYKQQVCKFTGN